MPRAKGSAEEIVANLNLRATEALHKARRATIIEAMKSRPQLVIDPLYEKLQSLGLPLETLGNVKDDGPKSRQAQAVEARKQARQDEQYVKRQ